MKLIDSGEGKVPLISAIAILAISLTVNLPGLAISPVLGKLKDVFHSTPLEVQLLNVLPNLLTIPFILGAGKICTPKNQLTVLSIGLLIFTATGVAYFFAKSMIILIVLSCILGVGIGLVIPLAASLISQNFSGKPRGVMLGTKSGLSNLSLILATLFVGWIASRDWHLAFSVYFIPLIPLVLVPFIKNKFINQARTAPALLSRADKNESESFHFQGKAARDMMWFALIIYFIVTYGALVFSYYLPFTMDAYGMSTSKVGVATSMFYLSATLAGFGLSKVIKATGVWTFQLAMILMTLALFGIGFIHTYASYIIGVFCLGLGYGVVQPILYDKTSYFAPNDEKSTEYFALLLTSTYVALSTIPFIVEFFGTFIKGNTDPSFPFILNGVIMTLLSIVIVVKHKNFVVQAGVIPQAEGLLKQPSSILAPGDRYITSTLQGNSQSATVNAESVALESEAPVGVPMQMLNNPSPSTGSVSSDTVETVSGPSVELSTVAPLSPAPITPTGKAADIMKAAETTLAQARGSIQDMRRRQSEMLKSEAAQLEQRSRELHLDAEALLEEANALVPPQETETTKQPDSTKQQETPKQADSGPDTKPSASSDEPKGDETTGGQIPAN